MAKNDNRSVSISAGSLHFTRRELARIGFGGVAFGGLAAAGLLGTSSNSYAQNRPASASTNLTINIGVANLAAQTADPHLCRQQNASRAFSQITAEPLVGRDLDAALVGRLATEWKTSSDGLTWTFTLRPNVKMQDGSSFTAADLKTAMDRIVAGGADFSFFAPLVRIVAAVNVIDDLHVEVVTKTPFGTLLDDLPAPIPTAYYKQVGEAGFRKQPMAAGNYRFDAQQMNRSMTFQRFDDFWDKSRLTNVKTVNLQIIPEAATQVAGLRAGSLDIATNLDATSIRQLQGAQGIRLIQIEGVGQADISFTDMYHPQTPTPALDVRVRRALLHAIDRPAILKSIYNGSGRVDENLLTLITPGYNPALKIREYNPDLAKQLLREAGQSNMSIPLRWRVADTSIPDVLPLAQAIVSYWEQVGVKVQPFPTDATAMSKAALDHTITGVRLVGHESSLFLDPATSMLTNIWSKGIASTILDTNLDAKIEDMSATLDPKLRADKALAITNYLYDNAGKCAIIHLAGFSAIGPKVAEFQTQKSGIGGFGPWWNLKGA